MASGAAAAALLAGAALDHAFGDPARWHPVAGFGRGARAAERVLYRPTRTAGVAHATLAVAVPTAATWAVSRVLPRAPLAAACLWAALGGRSLRRVAAQLGAHVDAGDLPAARALAPSLVSRRPDELDGPQLTRAAVESLAENTADAVIGPLLYTALAGPAGAVAYRAANTLDAMVGYKSPRYSAFGWGAARLDDVLNWPVARLTATATVLAAPFVGGDAGGALRTWRADGHRHPSPNAGRVEAAFAGALGVQLGGPADYGGTKTGRPALGTGPSPDLAALDRAVRLSATVGWGVAGSLAAASLVGRPGARRWR